jgi:hypothetical protein
MKKSYMCATFLFLFASFAFTHQAFATTASSTPVQNQGEVEKEVRTFFADTPVMIEIARCESKFRQFTDAGNVLRGGGGGGMVGVFQFYESIHASAAKSLGYDITTLKGNLGYAKHVYTTEGTTPWNSAKYCWDVPLTKPTLTTADREVLLKKIETLTKLIALLQKQLEARKALATK